MRELQRSKNMWSLTPSESCPELGRHSDVAIDLSNENGTFNGKPAELRDSPFEIDTIYSTLKSKPRDTLTRFSLKLCSAFYKVRGGTVDNLPGLGAFSKLHWVDRGKIHLKHWNLKVSKKLKNARERRRERLKHEKAVHTNVNEQDSNGDLLAIPQSFSEPSDFNTTSDEYLLKLSSSHNSIGPKNVYPPPRGLNKQFGPIKEVLLDVRGISPYGEETLRRAQKVSEEEKERRKKQPWEQLPSVWDNYFNGKAGDLDDKRILYRILKERMTNSKTSKKNNTTSNNLPWAVPELFMDQETSIWLGTQRQQCKEWENKAVKGFHARNEALVRSKERSSFTSHEVDWINTLTTSQRPLWHRYVNQSLAKRSSLAEKLVYKLHRLPELTSNWKNERLVRLWILVEQLKSDARRSWITTTKVGKALVKRPIRQDPAKEVTNYDDIDWYSLPDVGGAASIYSFTNLNVFPLYKEEMLEKWIRLRKRVYKVKSIMKLTKRRVSEQLKDRTSMSKRQQRLAFHPVVSLGRFHRCTAIDRDTSLQASRQAIGESSTNLEYVTDDETTHEEEYDEEVPEISKFPVTSGVSKKLIYQGIYQRILDDQFPDSRTSFEEKKKGREAYQSPAPLGKILRPFTSSSLTRTKIFLRDRLSFGKGFEGRKAVVVRPKLSPSNLLQSTFSFTTTKNNSRAFFKSAGSQGTIPHYSFTKILDQQNVKKASCGFDDLRWENYETENSSVKLFSEGTSIKVAENDSKGTVFKAIIGVLKTVKYGLPLKHELELESTMLSEGPHFVLRFKKQKQKYPFISILAAKHRQMESSKTRYLSILEPKDRFVDWMKSSLSPSKHRKRKNKHLRGRSYNEQDLFQRERLYLLHQKGLMDRVFRHPYKEHRSDKLQYSMATKILRYFHKRRPAALELKQWLAVTSVLGLDYSLISSLFYYEMGLLGRLQETQESNVLGQTPANVDTHSFMEKKFSMYSDDGIGRHRFFGLLEPREGISSTSSPFHYQETLKLPNIPKSELCFKVLPREFQFDIPNKPKRKSSILPPGIMQLPNETQKKITLFGRVVRAFTAQEVRALSLCLEFTPYPRIPKPQLEHHRWSPIEIDVPGNEKRLYFKPFRGFVPSPKPLSQQICDHARLNDAVRRLFILREVPTKSDCPDEHQDECLDECTSHSTSLNRADKSKKLSTSKKSRKNSRWKLLKEVPYQVAEGYFKRIFPNMIKCSTDEYFNMITSNVIPERVKLVHLDFDGHSNTVQHKTSPLLSKEPIHTKHMASFDCLKIGLLPQYLVEALIPLRTRESPKQWFCPDYTIHQNQELTGLKRVSDFNKRSEKAMKSFNKKYPNCESEKEESLLIHDLSTLFS